jgi:hypothetical protein
MRSHSRRGRGVGGEKTERKASRAKVAQFLVDAHCDPAGELRLYNTRGWYLVPAASERSTGVHLAELGPGNERKTWGKTPGARIGGKNRGLPVPAKPGAWVWE